MKLEFRQRLLASTLLVGASMVATPAFAQITAPPPPGEDQAPDTSAVTTVPETTTPPAGQTVVTESAEGEAIERPVDIVVTGTRIPQPNLEAASPVTVVTAQEVKLSGTTRTEDLINSLPQSFAAQGSNVSNGATGTATVNLRGLGTSRTMVLINGRRAQPGDPRQPVADLNFIPAPLIRRVDVLTGGASSVYGADAVAGVVNFIMDTTFRGLRIDGQASTFWHHNDTDADIIAANEARGFRPPRGNSVNGGSVDVAVAFGAGFDDNRGNVMGYATYRKQDPVLQATRDYSFCALDARTEAQDPSVRRFNCGGSGTSPTGTFLQFDPVTFAGRPAFQTGEGGTFIPGSTPFNYAPYNFFQRPNERYTLGAFADYEINEMFNPYLEAMFMDSSSDAQIAPSGDFGNTNTLNCDNPLLSAQQQDFLCNQFPTFTDADGVERALVYTLRRNVEGGGRNDSLNHTSYRLVAGMRGDLHRGLSYDAYYNYGTTKLSRVYQNDFSVTRLNRALDVVEDPETGDPVCRAVLDGTDPNCVPWNIFTPGGVTQEALSYLQVPGFARGYVNQQIAQADLTILGGEYGMILPWSDRGIGINVGAAYARPSLNYEVDQALETGDLAGQGGPTVGVEGSYDVRELFTEVEVPIVSRSFIEEFTVRAGYRYSDYKIGDNSFSTDTYKVEAELAPVRDIRFRGSYNRAVRAPSVIELFTPQSIGLAGNFDPCAGATPTATLAQCQLTGVTAAQYGQIAENPAGQYNALFGGNQNLSPESADTYTLGIVLQPRFVPGLALTVDWFDITINDLISVAGGGYNTIVNQCIGSGQLCEFINRAPGTGSLWLPVIDPADGGFVDLRNTNIGGLSTRGVDLQASYARGIGALGNLNLSLVGTWLDELITNPFADIEYDCVGFYGGTCGTPNPEWRHKFRAGITMPNGIGISGQWRFFSSVEDDRLSSNQDLSPNEYGPGMPGYEPGIAKLNSASFFDLTLTARMAERYNLRLGVNNIFDRDPPMADGNIAGPPFGNGNTYPQVYDALGRFLFAGVTVDF